MQLFGETFTKDQILRRVGGIEQMGGVRRCRLAEGRQDGVDAVDFRTGGGLNFTVLPGRGMDISFAEYQGIPLNWRSPGGVAGGGFFEPQGWGWLRGFFGGMVTTTGLAYTGVPCADQGEELGMCGRISHIPAANVWADGGWEGDEYIMWARGRVREFKFEGYDLQLERRVWAVMGEKRFHIHDRVENMGFDRVPFMMNYHVVCGFPVVDEGAELCAPVRSVTPVDDVAAEGLHTYDVASAPVPGHPDWTFYLELGADQDGLTQAAVINRRFEGQRGLGLYVRYNMDNLPLLWSWRQQGEGLYVWGLEPSNCHWEGRAAERERGTLRFLEPGQVAENRLEIGVLDGGREIDAFQDRVRSLEE
jgi:hypothetical protein